MIKVQTQFVLLPDRDDQKMFIFKKLAIMIRKSQNLKNSPEDLCPFSDLCFIFYPKQQFACIKKVDNHSCLQDIQKVSSFHRLVRAF